MIAMLWVLCGASVIGLVLSERAGFAPGRAVFKLLAASAFVGSALAHGALASPYGIVMLIGLVLCWLGDALLLPSGQTLWFKLGIAAFLLGHVAYSVAFTLLGLSQIGVGIGLVMVVFGADRVFRWLRPHIPDDFKIPVIAYVVVISLMLVSAAGAVAEGATLWLGLGALGFALSDLSVARDRFIESGFVNAAWGLPAYFLSQMLLASSVASVFVAE